MKNTSIGTGDAFHRYRYDVIAPHVRGFLTRHDQKTEEIFEFRVDGRKFGISIHARGEQDYRMEDIIATIKPLEDIDKAYAEMETLYNNNPGYPKDLLILSMISLKGPQENYQKEYLINKSREEIQMYEKWLKSEDKEDKKEWYREHIADLKANIEYFQSRMK